MLARGAEPHPLQQPRPSPVAAEPVPQLDARADGEAMIEAADRALYAAKQAGRATVRRAAAR